MLAPYEPIRVFSSLTNWYTKHLPDVSQEIVSLIIATKQMFVNKLPLSLIGRKTSYLWSSQDKSLQTPIKFDVSEEIVSLIITTKRVCKQTPVKLAHIIFLITTKQYPVAGWTGLPSRLSYLLRGIRRIVLYGNPYWGIKKLLLINKSSFKCYGHSSIDWLPIFMFNNTFEVIILW